jgi:hypothetical protein
LSARNALGLSACFSTADSKPEWTPSLASAAGAAVRRIRDRFTAPPFEDLQERPELFQRGREAD